MQIISICEKLQGTPFNAEKTGKSENCDFFRNQRKVFEFSWG
jgi:hypothetical protein